MEAYEGLLTDLRIAGDTKSVRKCADRLVTAGPEAAVQRACTSVQLMESTHATARADLELVSAAAEILESEEADRHLRTAIAILMDERRYAKRVRPTFLIHVYVLRMLDALLSESSVSQPARRDFLDYVLALPAVEDQSFASGLARALKRLPQSDWTPADIATIRQRSGDNRELEDAVVGIAAAVDNDAEEELLNALRQGETRMLSKVRDVSRLPQDVAATLIAALSKSVTSEVAEARAGRFFRNDARSLAMLNVWHPAIADWSPIYEMLAEPRVMPRSLIDFAAFLRDANKHVQHELREPLCIWLEHVRDRTPIDFGDWREAEDQTRTIIREALDGLAPGAVSDRELWALVGGDSEQRSAAARIIGRRRDYSRIDVLACLAKDDATVVRAHAAQWIASWLENPDTADRCNALLEDLAAAPGVLVGRGIVSGLGSRASRAAAGEWVTKFPLPAADDGEDE